MAKSYKNPNPTPGVPLITTISTGCKTPKMEVKYCNLVNPFYYPNSPKIPRYSVTCVIDPEEHREFLEAIQTIEQNEKVESVIKHDSIKDSESGKMVTSGKLNIKFQSKDKVPIFIQKDGVDEEIELEDEFARGEKIEVVYEIIRFTKKNSINVQHGITFKPTLIYFYPSEEK